MPWTAGRIHGPAAAHSAFQLRATVGRVVDEARGTHVGAPGKVDRLGGRQVAALVVVLAGVAQARLDQQEIGAAREFGHRVTRPGIAELDQARAIWRFDATWPTPARNGVQRRSGP